MEDGNSASPPRSHADLEGREGRKDDANIPALSSDICVDRGVIRYSNGHVYTGQIKNGKRHGSGIILYVGGNVYDGEWKEDQKHGIGTLTSASGNVTEGEWKNNAPNGQVRVKDGSGQTYVGEVKDRVMHGWGKMTYPSGNVYEGEWRKGKEHGKGLCRRAYGDVYEGPWVGGKEHGRGTITKASGEVLDGEFVDGELIWTKARAQGVGTSPGASEGKQTEKEPRAKEQPANDLRLYDECTLRSVASQQRRLEKNLTAKKCERCGADDGRYKLRVCSGCNLALYCSAACQKAASRSHRRICDNISGLPPRDADWLSLACDKENMVDLDAGLRYATKYMDDLKHLNIDLTEMRNDGTVKFSATRLCSLFKSKKGKLDTVLWAQSGSANIPGLSSNGHEVWKELHGLRKLLLCYLSFDDVQPINDTILQQRNTLTVLCLPGLNISWPKAKTRRAFATAAGSCNHLVKLDLQDCVLMDPDLKIMLHNLPNLRILRLARDARDSHEFTDNTCSIIARKCPGLQELDLDFHNQLSVRGVRKIFEGCPHLRLFGTTSRKLSGNDVQSLLDIAPHLMYLSLSDADGISAGELNEIIEATGGRTLLSLFAKLFQPVNVSATTMLEYERRQAALNKIWSRRNDPECTNEWEGWADVLS